MSARSEKLKEAGWVQVSSRMWTVDWLKPGRHVDILVAEKMQGQLDALAHLDDCPHCQWPLSEVIRTSKGGGQHYVRCYGCRKERLTHSMYPTSV